MEQKDYRLAAIMYTDIAGFSRMMEKDEAGTLELLRYHNELIGGIVRDHHGTVIKTIGDALLVDFKNTVEAMQSALEIQDKLYAHNKENQNLPLLVRIGVHLGDIYFFENDALGEGINIAARLQSLASPGSICFSQDVYNLVLNKIEFRAEKLGKVSLKNITKEVHAYEITTPNAEFDPDRGKPRPGYKPGSYLGNGENGTEADAGENPESSTMATSHAPIRSPLSPPLQGSPAKVTIPVAPPAHAMPLAPASASPQAVEPLLDLGDKPSPERSYSPEASRQILDEIRKAILQDIKTEGRRLSVQEAIARYGSYGVEAKEVIASMAESGLLVRGERTGNDSLRGSGFPRSGFTGSGDGGFDPEALGRNIEAAVHGFVSEFEKNVGRGMSKRGSGVSDYESGGDRYRADYDRYQERHERRAERREAKDQIRGIANDLPTGKWDKKLAENETWNNLKQERSSTMSAYRGEVVARSRHLRGSFIGNVTSFLAVNAGLWYMSIATHAGFPSFLPALVTAAWGIGVVSSLVASMRGAVKANEVQTMPELDEGQLLTYKKLNRVKDSMAMHSASTITVPILLAVINLVVMNNSSFLWFPIPTAVMVLSLISHAGSFNVAKSKLQRELLGSLGIEGGWRNIFKFRKEQRTTSTELGSFASQYQDAERSKTAILAELRSSGTGDADLAPSLESYVGQVRLLAQSANEIDRIVGGIPMSDLVSDKASLQRKADAATSASLKEEYQHSIEEIEKQERSYDELKNQSEVIKLRLSSSVNQLKQMRIDMARLKAAGEDGSGGVNELKRRTNELTSYLQDIRKGYDEGNAPDPYAELEELAKANEAKKRLEDGAGKGS